MLPLAAPILQTTLADRRPDRQGKVRDIYDFGDRLLIVATDRISAFDYVLGSGIPDKGKVLTQISCVLVRAHAVRSSPTICCRPPRRRIRAKRAARPSLLQGRSMLVTPHRAAADRMRGARLPVRLGLEGLRRQPASSAAFACRRGCASRTGCLQPIFTPATKAQSGHDINITEKDAAELVGKRVLDRVKDLTLRLYAEGSAHAESCGIIVADTKFEFGLLPGRGRRRPARRGSHHPDRRAAHAGFLALLAEGHLQPGGAQKSFDKQFVRDYLERIRWNKQPPVPSLPDDVVARRARSTSRRSSLLTGRELDLIVISDRLERLVEEMVDRSVQFDDAVREFEKRFIVARAQRSATAA